MKTKYLLLFFSVLFITTGTLFSQDLKFTEDTKCYSYMQGDTLIKEYYTNCSSVGYKLNVEGGTEPYTYAWYNEDVTNVSDDSIRAKPSLLTGYALAVPTVHDAAQDSIFEYLYFYNKIIYSGLPLESMFDDTTYWIEHKPFLAQISGPGIYYDDEKQQYYFRPDSAGVGTHIINFSYAGKKITDPGVTCSGGGGTDPFTITVVPKLKVNAYSVSMCEFDSYPLSASVSGGFPPYTVEWQDPFGQTLQGQDISIVGWDYSVGIWDFQCTVTDAKGHVAETTANVEIMPMEYYMLTGSIPEYIYQDDPQIYLYVDDFSYSYYTQLNVRLNGAYYNNTNGFNEVIVDPVTLSSGDYNIAIEAYGMCGYDNWDFDFTVLEPLQIQLVSQTNYLCETDASIEITSNVTGGIEPYTYTWNGDGVTGQNQTAFFDPAIASAGAHTITLTVEDANGRVEMETIDVTVKQKPEPPLVTDVEYCIGDEASQLMVQGYGTIIWHDASFNTILVGESGPIPSTQIDGEVVYYVSQDVSGCESSFSELTVKVNPNPSPTIVPSNYTVCMGESFIAELTGGPYTPYNWSGSGTQIIIDDSQAAAPMLTGNESGTFDLNVEIADANGCKGSATATYTVLDIFAQIIEPTLPNEIYVSDAIIDLDPAPGHTFNGPGIVQSSYFDPSVAGVGDHEITIQVDACANSISSTFIIHVLADPVSDPLEIDGNPNETISVCYKGSEILTTNVTGGTAPYSYSWSYVSTQVGYIVPINNNNIEVFEPASNVQIQCVVEDSKGETVSKKFTIDPIFPEPVVSPTLPNPIYETDSPIELPTSVNQSYYGSGVISSGGKQFFDPAVNGVGTFLIDIYVSSNEDNGCVDTLPFVITVIEIPQDPLIITGNNSEYQTVCYKGEALLETEVTGGTVPYTYTWSYASSEVGEIIPVSNNVVVLNKPTTNVEVQCVVEDSKGETATKTFYITASSPVPVVYSALPTPIYEDAAPIDLLPAPDHSFGGPGIVVAGGTTYFDPSLAGVGTHTIDVYTNSSDISGCIDTNFMAVEVVEPCNLTAAFTVEKVIGEDSTYVFKSLEDAEFYQWNIVEGTFVDLKSFKHKFEGKLPDEVCLTLGVGQYCDAVGCKPLPYPIDTTFYIKGQVWDNNEIIDCGITVAYRFNGSEYEPVDTSDVTANGYYHGNLLKGVYVVKAEACNESEYLPTYYLSASNVEDAVKIPLYDHASSVDIHLLKNGYSSIQFMNSNGFRVYPNPMCKQATIFIDNPLITEIQILNIQGLVVNQFVVNSNEMQLFKNELSSGVYTIVGRNNNRVLYQQLLVIK